MDWSFYQCFVTVMFCGLVFKLDSMSQKPRRSWRKWATIAVAIVIFFASGITLERGWPSRHELPHEFIFLHAVVQPPSATSTGMIVVLIRTKEHPELPFSVILPYSEELGVTLELASMQTLLEGEIPVTFIPGKGFVFHIKHAPSSGEHPAKGTLIKKPFYRSA